MKSLFGMLMAALLLSVSVAQAGEVDPAKLPEKKKTPQGLYLTPKEAFEMLKGAPEGILFVDVRTPSELEFVGAAEQIDANVPYMLNDFSDWDVKKAHFKKVPNSNFMVAMEEKLAAKGLDKNSKIILMCRSGDRSSKAANLMFQAGYKNVYSVVEGFEGDKLKNGPQKGQRLLNGWKNAGLPWSYKLDQQKMYIEML